jgi:hypothetical protein
VHLQFFFPSPSALTILISINFTHLLAYFKKKALQTMLFSSKTWRFALFSFLSLSANAENIRGTHRELVVYPQPADAPLGKAADYAILAETGITTVPYSSSITGDIAVSPIGRGAMTGFNFVTSNTYAESTLVNGRAYSATDESPTPGNMITAVNNMHTAYEDVKGRTANEVTYGPADLGGRTLKKGVYWFNALVEITSTVTFDGTANDIFIIQTTGDLVQAANIDVILANGAQAKNIFWQVAGFVTVGAGAHMEGILLVKTKVDFITGSTMNGRVLSQTACNLDHTTIVSANAGVGA